MHLHLAPPIAVEKGLGTRKGGLEEALDDASFKLSGTAFGVSSILESFLRDPGIGLYATVFELESFGQSGESFSSSRFPITTLYISFRCDSDGW